MKGKLILPYIMLNLLCGIGSAVMFYLSDFNPIWVGVFFATFTMPFFLMVLSQALRISRTSKNLPAIQLINMVSVAGVAYSFTTRSELAGTSDYIALGLALFGAVSLQWYIRIFSHYGRTPSTKILHGATLPALPLQQLDGSPVSSASFNGDKTLLVFFRANWCPFCMNQLNDVRAASDRLANAGVKVKFISNQGIDNSTKLATRLDIPTNFEILQDNDLAAAKILGIEDMGGAPTGMPGYPVDTVMATVIALDESGTVIFGDETDNYRMRPHPDTFLHVFENVATPTAIAA